MAIPVKYLKKTNTEPLLKAALLNKMETKPLARVTIKELCETAGVYRSTFYCHYNDVESLYCALEKDIFADVDKAYNAFITKELTSYEYCKALCDMVRNGKYNIAVLFRDNNPDSSLFRARFVAHLTEQVKNILPNANESAVNFVIAGAVSCVVTLNDVTTDEIVHTVLSICKTVK